MTLVYDAGREGPGTHALLIGVSAYESVLDGRYGPAAANAVRIANWLMERFHNPEAPLATVDLLTTDGIFQPEWIDNDPRRGAGTIGRPDLEALRTAADQWLERADSDPGNIAFFYFAGLGARVDEDLLLLPADSRHGYFTFSEFKNPLSFNSLVSAACAAGRQIFVVDSNCSSTDLRHTPKGGHVWVTRPSATLRPKQFVLHASAPTDSAPLLNTRPHSPIAVALTVALDQLAEQSAPDPVRTAALFPGVGQILRAVGISDPAQLQRLELLADDDFDLHYSLEREAESPDGAEPSEAAAPRSPSVADETAPAPEAEAAQTLAEDAGPPSAEPAAASFDPGEAPAEASVAGATPEPAGEAPEPPSPRPAGAPAALVGEANNTEFIQDDAETERDELGRAVLALGLARRLHRIWRSSNGDSAAGRDETERAAFVLHLDAPWGGGKTTFANFLARVLDPLGAGRPAAFLMDRYGDADLGGIFLEDPPADAEAVRRIAELPDHVRKPWIVVTFNAWQVEHCSPPWWVFYQAIRKRCFDAIRAEGSRPWVPGKPGSHCAPAWQRYGQWLKLWLKEYAWRLGNPKVRSLLVTALVSLFLLLLLQWTNAWGIVEGKDGLKAGFTLSSGLGVVLAGLSGVTALWGLGALFTESIVPGTDTLAERLSLGAGDPFARFRRHFAMTMKGTGRPVMVVVDDLDRCKPEFVVDLVRGMQTLLRSPRVVFVILGDRDWIERAFETHHQTMSKVDVGPEQTFGARFVEKAIQMSFILPAMGDEGRIAYVRKVLLGPGESRPQASRPIIDSQSANAVREVANRVVEAPGADPFNTDRIVKLAMEELKRRPRGGGAAEPELESEVERLVGETLAINATTSEGVERAVSHQLEALAAHFPANPRQIKRIVNAITIYYAVALQRPGIVPDQAFRAQLALWVIIMTEWPETWRLLASFPALVDILQADRPSQAIRALGADSPGSAEAIAAVVARMRSDKQLTALIRGEGGVALDGKLVPLLAELTPLHSRKRRLEDTAAPPATPAQARKRLAGGKAPRSDASFR